MPSGSSPTYEYKITERETGMVVAWGDRQACSKQMEVTVQAFNSIKANMERGCYKRYLLETFPYSGEV